MPGYKSDFEKDVTDLKMVFKMPEYKSYMKKDGTMDLQMKPVDVWIIK